MAYPYEKYNGDNVNSLRTSGNSGQGHGLGGKYIDMLFWKLEVIGKDIVIIHNTYFHLDTNLNCDMIEWREACPNGDPRYDSSWKYKGCEHTNFTYFFKYHHKVFSYYYEPKLDVYYFMNKNGYVFRGKVYKKHSKRNIDNMLDASKIKKMVMKKNNWIKDDLFDKVEGRTIININGDNTNQRVYVSGGQLVKKKRSLGIFV